MERIGKTRTVYNFLNTCNKCFNDIEYPLLGEFSFGELIFQTIDGQDYFLVELIDNKTLDFIFTFLKSKSEQKISKTCPHKILALLADKVKGKGFAIDFPICPKCKSIQNHFNDNIRTTQREIGFATWVDFESLTVDAKAKRLENVISLCGSHLR